MLGGNDKATMFRK